MGYLGEEDLRQGKVFTGGRVFKKRRSTIWEPAEKPLLSPGLCGRAPRRKKGRMSRCHGRNKTTGRECGGGRAAIRKKNNEEELKDRRGKIVKTAKRGTYYMAKALPSMRGRGERPKVKKIHTGGSGGSSGGGHIGGGVNRVESIRRGKEKKLLSIEGDTRSPKDIFAGFRGAGANLRERP